MNKRQTQAAHVPEWADETAALRFPIDSGADNAQDANAQALAWAERGFIAQAVGVPRRTPAGEIVEWVCRIVGMEPQ